MQNITWHAICHRAMHVVSDELPLQAVKVPKVVKAKQMQSGHGWLIAETLMSMAGWHNGFPSSCTRSGQVAIEMDKWPSG